MLNSYKLNSGALSIVKQNSWLIKEDIYFNDFGLQNKNIISSFADWDNFININYNDYNNPNSDWNSYISRFFRWKTINLKIRIRGDDKRDFQDKRDEFIKNTVWEQTWILGRRMADWNFRTIEAKVSSCNILENHYNISFQDANITFNTEECFWKWEWIVKNYLDLTNNRIQVEITNDGNFSTYPLITFSIKTWSSWVDQLYCETEDQKITYNWALIVWNVVVIDCANEIVKINWTETRANFEGTFPILKKSYNTVWLGVNWTPLYDVSIAYHNKY